MLIKNNYRATLAASYSGYITQAIMLSFPPLLFIFFQEHMGLSLSQVSVLISANFVTELIVDILASRYAARIGYRPLVIVGNSFASVGLISMFLLPMIIKNSFVALIISMMLCGIGVGIMWPGDFGCLAGPSMAGYIFSIFDKDLRVGFAVSLVFPITLTVICGIMLFKKKKQK